MKKLEEQVEFGFMKVPGVRDIMRASVNNKLNRLKNAVTGVNLPKNIFYGSIYLASIYAGANLMINNGFPERNMPSNFAIFLGGSIMIAGFVAGTKKLFDYSDRLLDGYLNGERE